MKNIIHTELAPKALGPYSQGVEINGMLFVSGQVAINPETGKLVEGGIQEQTKQVLQNIAAILDAAGYQFSDVVKSTVLLNDMSDFAAMNEIYAQFYTENQPARAAYSVKGLPINALVEIETIAVK
jgi:2-iminobutanoate/2-iminopropanoate deaminase